MTAVDSTDSSQEYPLLRVAGVAIAISLSIYWILWRHQKKLPYPPGPRPLPLIGNVHQLPDKLRYQTYAEWGKKYGT